MELFKSALLRTLILVGIYLLIGIIINWIFSKLQKKRQDIHLQLIRKLIRLVLVILCIGTVGMQFEVTRELTSMLLRSSALFVAVAGFAAQQALADVISGFMMAWNKPFNVGERIMLVNNNIAGFIEEVTMRHTIIRLYDNNRLIVPNSVMNKEIIMNNNIGDPKSGNFIEVEISYESDVDLAIELIKDIIRDNPLLVDKENPQVLIKDFSANGIILKTTVYARDINENFIASSDVRREILRRFSQNGIQIPYPHVQVSG